MNADHNNGWTALQKAAEDFRKWAASLEIPVNRIEHVATFEPWDKCTEIYVFLATDSDLQRFEGKLHSIEERYREFLSNALYPFDRWPVTFHFDSHENVVKNYQGNYFYRLR
jgi:hypothetical protein